MSIIDTEDTVGGIFFAGTPRLLNVDADFADSRKSVLMTSIVWKHDAKNDTSSFACVTMLSEYCKFAVMHSKKLFKFISLSFL